MKFKAEIFDKLQYLFEVTKFNDHQLHCIIKFRNQLNEVVLKKALDLLIKTIPILSTKYVPCEGESYWLSVEPSEWEECFHVEYNETEFYNFTVSKGNELAAPQIKVCLLRANEDSLSIIMNHMVCDGSDFKQCLYLFSYLYSKLMVDSNYCPDFIINGERSIKKIYSEFTFYQKLKALLLKGKETNQEGSDKFPMSKDKHVSPFILTHEISSERYLLIKEYSRNNKVTMNDVVLAAYYRGISKFLNNYDRTLSIPIMVDMRKYLRSKDFCSLSNLASTETTNITLEPNETFQDTLNKISTMMELKKKQQIGLNGFVKLAYVHQILGDKISYRIIKKALASPNICMTNIGILDSEKLFFQGSTIKNAFVTGSIKYRPHFQVALSSFDNQMTFSVNLYGNNEDRKTIMNFFVFLDKELPQ